MLVRSRKQLADVVARDPLGKVAKNPSRYLVTFLRSKPPAKACASSLPRTSRPSSS